MKKILSLSLALVLTAALFTGCGCTRRDAQYTTAPTTMTMPTILPTTESTTVPTSQAQTQPTVDRGNGPLEDTATGTESTDTATEGSSRGMDSTVNKK